MVIHATSPLPTDVPLATAVQSSPFLAATQRWGCRVYGLYNGLQVPLQYTSLEEDYWNRTRDVVLCDASAETHVEIEGPDAATFVQWLTATDVDALRVGELRHCLMVDESGGVIGDPLVLRLAVDRYWLAQDNTDLLPWIKGVTLNAGLDVLVSAPSVATLALEGTRAPAVMQRLLGPAVAPLAAHEVREIMLDDWPLLVSPRLCGELPAFSLRLRDLADADGLWERVIALGEDCGISPAAQSPVHRMEAGIPGMGVEMNADSDPYDLGVGALVDLEQGLPFIGSAALPALKARGLRQRLVGVTVLGERLGRSDLDWWTLSADGEAVGDLRSTAFSPRLERTIGLAVVLLAYAEPGVRLRAESPDGIRECRVEGLPFG